TLSPHHTSLQQARPHNLSAIRHLLLVHRILMLCIRPLRRKSKTPRAQQHRTIQLKKQADSGSSTLSLGAGVTTMRGHWGLQLPYYFPTNPTM
ncbi:hypothetical protein KXV31_008631, partial [Aspergillus fumigatus]